MVACPWWPAGGGLRAGICARVSARGWPADGCLPRMATPCGWPARGWPTRGWPAGGYQRVAVCSLLAV